MTDLRSAFENLGKPAAAPAAEAERGEATEEAKRPDAREDTVHVGGYFRPEVDISIDDVRTLIRRRTGKKVTKQKVLAHALNLLFAKFELPEIAPGKLPRGSNRKV